MDFIKANFGALIGLALPIGIVLFTLYFILKSNSAATIYNKLWSLLFGEKDFHNNTINNFAKAQHDIDKFNFIYGFRFQDFGQLERFIQWIEANDYQIYWFSNLGSFFDRKTFEIKRISNSLLWFSFSMGILSLSALTLWVINNFIDPVMTSKSVGINAISYVAGFELVLCSFIFILLLKIQVKGKKTLNLISNKTKKPS